MKRNTFYDFYRRTSLDPRGYYCNPGSDNIEGLSIAYDESIASIDGAHYHCWIPRGLSRTEEKELLKKFQRAARAKGDPVSFSWDYIPNVDVR